MNERKKLMFLRIVNIALYTYAGVGLGLVIFYVIFTFSDIAYGPNWLMCAFWALVYALGLVVLSSLRLISKAAIEKILPDMSEIANKPRKNPKSELPIAAEGEIAATADAVLTESVIADASVGKKTMSAGTKYEIISVTKVIVTVLIILAIIATSVTFYFPHQDFRHRSSFIHLGVCVGAIALMIIAYFATRHEIIKTIPSSERLVARKNRVLTFSSIAMYLLLALILMLFSTYTVQNTVLYVPNAFEFTGENNPLRQGSYAQYYHELEIVGGQGQVYSGRMYAPHGNTAPTLLVFYGNSMNSEILMTELAGNIISGEDGGVNYYEGYNIVTFDYPGYGKSPNTPNEAAIYRMVLSAYSSLGDYNGLISSSNVVVMGYSVGTGFAAYLAAERDVDGLILVAPYSNGTDLCNSYLPIFYGPMQLLVANNIPSTDYAKSIKKPPLIIASEADMTVKVELSRALVNTFNLNAGCTYYELPLASSVAHDELLINKAAANQIKQYLSIAQGAAHP